MTVHRHDNTGPRPAGFTLVEVLLATFVLALGVLGLAALFAGGIRQQQMTADASRTTTLAESALAWQANFGVMSSLDENGNGRPDFEEFVDMGRWYALGTMNALQPDNINWQRVSMVAMLGNGTLQRFDGATNDSFQPFFRKVNNTPVVLYQRPKFWRPQLNEAGGLSLQAEASHTVQPMNPLTYDPQRPGSTFSLPPYRLYDAKPLTPAVEKALGPAFLPHRAILPESVEITVTYYEYATRALAGMPPDPDEFDPFTLPSGTGLNPPGDNGTAANVLGRSFVDPQISSFRWVDPRSSLVSGIALNARVPGNTLPNQVLSPTSANSPSFPSEDVWRPNGDTDLYYYGVFTPGGAYPLVDVNNLPAPDSITQRPAYLVMYLSPDLKPADRNTPNPTIVAYELAGVLTDRFMAPTELVPDGQEVGPLRSVEQIRVDRYVARVEQMPDLRDRVISVLDPQRPQGRRPVVGYSLLYRRTPDGNGELAVFGYSINPTSRPVPQAGSSALPTNDFVPFEHPTNFRADGDSPIATARFDVRWDDNRGQFYVIHTGGAGTPESVIRPGTLILFGGGENPNSDVYGADAAVRIQSRVRVGNELRGYLEDAPRYRGKPLGTLATQPPSTQTLVGWFVRDRVRSMVSQETWFQLEAVDVRVVPMTEK
jgi:hypothetical protein